MKKLGFVLAVLFILVFIAAAYAQGPVMAGGEQGWNFCPYCGNYIGPRGGYGMGPGMMGGYGRCPGPNGCYNQSDECQKFLNDTSKERKELYDKKFEYQEAYRNPKTSPEALTKVGKEIWDLKEKIYSKAPLGCW